MILLRRPYTLRPGVAPVYWDDVVPARIPPTKLKYRDDFGGVTESTSIVDREIPTAPAGIDATWGATNANLRVLPTGEVSSNSNTSHIGALILEDPSMTIGEAYIRGQYGGPSGGVTGRVGVAFRGDGFGSGGSWVAYMGSLGLALGRIDTGDLTTILTVPLDAVEGRQYNVRASWTETTVQAWCEDRVTGEVVTTGVVNDATWADRSGFGITIRGTESRLAYFRAGQ